MHSLNWFFLVKNKDKNIIVKSMENKKKNLSNTIFLTCCESCWKWGFEGIHYTSSQLYFRHERRLTHLVTYRSCNQSEEEEEWEGTDKKAQATTGTTMKAIRKAQTFTKDSNRLGFDMQMSSSNHMRCLDIHHISTLTMLCYYNNLLIFGIS